MWLDVDFWAAALWREGIPTLRGTDCPSLARWMNCSYAWAQAGPCPRLLAGVPDLPVPSAYRGFAHEGRKSGGSR